MMSLKPFWQLLCLKARKVSCTVLRLALEIRCSGTWRPCIAEFRNSTILCFLSTSLELHISGASPFRLTKSWGQDHKCHIAANMSQIDQNHCYSVSINFKLCHHLSHILESHVIVSFRAFILIDNNTICYVCRYHTHWHIRGKQLYCNEVMTLWHLWQTRISW